MTTFKVSGYGWTLVIMTRSATSSWELRVRYERLALPELFDVIAQELGGLEEFL
jgi:hypothetical protein